MSLHASISKTIVVFGATGNIGVPLVQTLSSHNVTPSAPVYNILALSRNSESNSAKNLSKLPGVKVIQVPANNMDEPLAALSSTGVRKGELHGVFSVQGYVSYNQDIAQGKAIAEAAVALGARLLVYLSTDFGGLSDTGSGILERKRVVENHIKTLDIPYTFLRPAQFMDNLLPTSPFPLRVGRTMLIHNTFKTHPERKHQMVSARDIGRAAALAFHEPENWSNRVFPLAADEFTMPELLETYRNVMGTEVNTTSSLLTGFARAVVPDARAVADFFDKTGYDVNIEACRRELPDMDNLESFLRRFKAKQS